MKFANSIKFELKMKALEQNCLASCMNNRVNSPRIQYILAPNLFVVSNAAQVVFY